MMNAASAGSATGPPCASTRISGLTSNAAAAQASMRSGQSSSFSAVCAPIAPPVVRPRWQTMISAPAGGIEHVGRGQHVLGACFGDHLDLQGVGHAGLFEIGAKDAVDQSDGRKVLHAGK